MSLQTLTPPVEQLDEAPLRRPRARWGDRMLHLYTWLIIFWLLSPIIVMILFSFNDNKSRRNTTWQGFTLRHYGEAFDRPDLREAVINSIVVAVITMLAAGALGTLVGIALGRYQFRGSGVTNLVMFAVIASPEL